MIHFSLKPTTTSRNSGMWNNRPEVVHPFRLLALIIMAMTVLAFVGCKTPTPSIPTNSHRDSGDSIRKELRVDTIYQDRWHTKYMKGDTVFIHDSIDRWHNKYVYIHDSIDNIRIDTIYQPVQVEKQYKAFLVNSGVALWVIVTLFVLSVIIGIVIKIAK